MIRSRLLIAGLLLACFLPLPHLSAAEITAVLFTPDGKTVIAANTDGQIRWLDAPGGQERRKLDAHKGAAHGLALSRDGKTLASAGGDGLIKLWDVASGKELSKLTGHTGAVTAVAFAPDARTLASGGYDGQVRLWDLDKGKELRSFQVAIRVTAVSFAPDGKTLMTGGTKRTAAGGLSMVNSDDIRTWEVASGKEVLKLAGHGVHAVCAAAAPIVASGGYGVYSVGPGEPAQLRINQMGFQVRSQGHVWNAVTGKELMKVVGGGSVALSSNGRLLATGRGTERHIAGTAAGITFGHNNAPQPTRVWEVTTGQELLRLDNIGDGLSLSLSPDGRLLAIGRRDGSVVLQSLAPKGWDAFRAAQLPEEQLEGLGKNLSTDDAPKAHEAVWSLTAVGNKSLPILEKMLRVPAPDKARVKQLIEDLDSNRFPTRERASLELRKLGAAVEADLRRASKTELSVEALRRVDEMLALIDRPGGAKDRLGQSRALLVLERLGTPEARTLMQTLAGGDAEAWLTQEAMAIWQRQKTP